MKDTTKKKDSSEDNEEPKTPTFAKLYNNEVGVARALYSNTSEYPEELAFQRGETLRVLHDPIGPELSPGWWLCVDSKGKRGIVPANRLEVMQPFDKGFFQVANPLFDDFFMFSGERMREADPFETAFGQDRRRRFFAPFFDDFGTGSRTSSPAPERGLHATTSAASIGGLPSFISETHPIRRLSSVADDVGFRGVVRNIPIRVEQRESAPTVSSMPRFRENNDFLPTPHPVRRAASSGQLSPPLPDDLRSIGSQGTLLGSPRLGGSSSRLADETPIMGRFSDFPSQRKERTEEESGNPVERLAQRLKNLAAKQPFASESRVPPDPQISRERIPEPPSREPVRVPITVVDRRSPSPSSSGIVADIADVTNSDENKRSSDLSSLSGGSDGNSSFEVPEERTPTTMHSNLPDRFQDRTSDRREEVRRERDPPPPAPSFTKPTSTSVLQSVFDSIERPKLRPLAGSRNDVRNTDTAFMPSSIAEDMRRNENGNWRTVPTKVNTPQQRSISSISDSEMVTRKRIIINKMTECLRMIQMAKDRLEQATAAQHWREPHVLQKNLNEIRDSVITINEALDHFVDSTARVAIDKASAKNDDFRYKLMPLRDSRALVGALRQALDLGGWTLATLARDKNKGTVGLDSIEQFRILVRKVPQECRELLDWLSLLAPDPPRVCFMAACPSWPSEDPSPTAHFGAAPTARAVPAAASPTVPQTFVPQPQTTLPFPQPTVLPTPPPQSASPVQSDDSKRLSSSSTSSSTVTSGDSSTSPPSSILKGGSNGNNNNGNSNGRSGARVTFADDVDSPSRRLPNISNGSADRLSLNSTGSGGPGISLHHLSHPSTSSSLLNGESSIIEEDDLESVISDRDGLQDYAQLDDPLQRLRQPMHVARRDGNRKCSKLSDEDRQIVRFYAPQMAAHTDALSLSIDEFIDVVEHQLPPNEFVQKGKLIILAAHKLVYIGDSVSQCVKDAKLSVESRAAADQLCNLLKECVSATKTAAEEYPNISCVQKMVDSIVGVSKAATDLKLLVESHV